MSAIESLKSANRRLNIVKKRVYHLNLSIGSVSNPIISTKTVALKICTCMYILRQKYMVVGQLFSSPEHEVLMVSFCDSAVSGVLSCASLVVNFLPCVCSRGHIFSSIPMN